jgi:hypothetical protein
MLTDASTLRIEYWPIERLREYPRNPRKNDAAVDRMFSSVPWTTTYMPSGPRVTAHVPPQSDLNRRERGGNHHFTGLAQPTWSSTGPVSAFSVPLAGRLRP